MAPLNTVEHNHSTRRPSHAPPSYATVLSDSDSDASSTGSGCLFSIHPDVIGKQPHRSVNICDTPVTMMIDTGSSVNIIDTVTYNKFKHRPALHRTDIKLFAFQSESPIKVGGKFVTAIESKARIANATIYVVDGHHGSLLSYQTALDLKLISMVNTVKGTAEESFNNNHARVISRHW